jgi:opacity protein-like surface antigen
MTACHTVLAGMCASVRRRDFNQSVEKTTTGISLMRNALYLTVGVALLSVAAMAQENRSEVSIQGTGFFTNSTTGNGTAYSATDSAGVLGTYRYHLNRWISVEGAYGFDLNTQKYLVNSQAFRIQSNIHQFTGSFVVNLPSHGHSRLNPYFLAGGGALLFEPTSDQFNSISNAQSQTKAAFVYGAGVNYAIHKGVSLRAEYRGLLYSNPDFGFGSLATNSLTHTAVPSIGLSFRF